MVGNKRTWIIFKNRNKHIQILFLVSTSTDVVSPALNKMVEVICNERTSPKYSRYSNFTKEM